MLSVFLLDNVDSFSYNLVDELRALDLNVEIYRNTVDAQFIFDKMQQQSTVSEVVLVLSPGPGSPHEAGCMPALLRLVEGVFPVIGICLGHQAIVEHFGGTIERAATVLHGKSSHISHCATRMFADAPNPLPVARYHSLVATQLPDCLEITANYDGLTMAVYHDTAKMIGYQFHPESILTAHGSDLLMTSLAFLVKESKQLVKEID